MKRYPFGKFILDIPDDHRIIEIHRSNILYDRAYGCIIEEIARACPDGVFIDIGANIGDTAAFLATYSANPILCVEGSPTYAAYLRANLRHFSGQVRLIEKFLRTKSLARLKLGYEEGTGSGGLISSNNSSGPSIADEQFIDTVGLLKEASSLGSVSLVKTDTDGFDGYIVTDLLSAVDAPIFFECDTLVTIPDVPSPWPEVYEMLERNGYSIVIFDNHGLPMLLADRASASILRDLSGYIHLQRTVHPVRIHYLDVWAFPPSWIAVYERISSSLRSDFLKPFRF
ncbi:MAG: hypothetical protein KJ558_06995 [Gammaproteobacteria bacterium]|nr:hypothetical protein [Gammaproteobacteria bacterium]MBU1654565.1 hypothetical protein [Gammaproteobacteria bacterium]MBU1961957.1 hypothetical protein [Gammaproteobacteria bacterium]